MRPFSFLNRSIKQIHWWGFFGLYLLSMSQVLADEILAKTTPVTPTDPSHYFGKIMLSLVFILLIIFVFAWMLKRFGRFTGLNHVNMRLIGAINVGQKERIVLLEVGKTQMVIGVTPAEITLLHQLEQPLEVDPNQPQMPKGSFASRLEEAIINKRNPSVKNQHLQKEPTINHATNIEDSARD